MKLYKKILSALIIVSSCTIIPMDPPKPQPTKSQTTKQELTWINFIKNILLDKIPLQEHSAYALEDELGALDDGNHSFRYLNNDAQVSIVYFLKAYMTSGNQYEN